MDSGAFEPRSDMGRGLEELRRLIAESDRGDWNVIDCFGKAGPSYLASPWLAVDHDAYGDREHHARAAFRQDVAVGLAWGMVANDRYEAEWLEGFSNKRAHSAIADILYNGMLVAREYYLVVDGGRAKLPLPREDEGGQLRVSRQHCKLVKLLDEFDFYSGVRGGIGDRTPLRVQRLPSPRRIRRRLDPVPQTVNTPRVS
jgi:hypothetical protein